MRTSMGVPFPGVSCATGGSSGTSVGAAQAPTGKPAISPIIHLVRPGLRTESL
jgi:hypothetical protein